MLQYQRIFQLMLILPLLVLLTGVSGSEVCDKKNRSDALSLKESSFQLTGSELWDRVIAWHDPAGNWANFHGKVQIMTTFAQGFRVDEILEVNIPDDFYQSIRLAGEIEAVKGVSLGECFRHVNGNPNPTEEEIGRFVLDCGNTRWFKEHHTGHFGLPMSLKESGMVVEEEVLRVDIRGKSVYALQFKGGQDAVRHPYYAGWWTLYIDPDTYVRRGVRRVFMAGNETVDVLCVDEGELEIEGIKMNQVQTCYRDGSFSFVSTFTYVSE
jgi:hypothetical protein